MSNREHPVHIFINRKKFELDDSVQTGANLKELAGIPLTDVLFRQRPGDDEVIANDAAITLKNGDHLHSQPPADYGLGEILAEAGMDEGQTQVLPHADGWKLLVISGYSLPAGYVPDRVELLLKLPPTFPDAAPDMFWVYPVVMGPSGQLPRSTSIEHLLGRDWQRFSWHLVAGAWKPGVSNLRDFLRCVRARFLRLD